MTKIQTPPNSRTLGEIVITIGIILALAWFAYFTGIDKALFGH